MSSLDCTLVDVADQAMCATLNTLYGAVESLDCSSYGYDLDGTCVNYTSPLEKGSGLLGVDGELDSGNVAWMLIATALVMIMTPGLGLFYAGLSGEKSAGNTIMMSMASMGVVSLQWFLFGYSFAFAPGTMGFGDFSWGGLTMISQAPSGVYGVAFPHVQFVAFQMMFAMITPAIISGAIVGRMKFWTWCIFVFIWTTIVYDPLAHWVWAWKLDEDYQLVPAGYLVARGALDFAGGTVIHIASGFSSIAVALVLGPREDKLEKLTPHNTPFVVIGASLLWIGWFGFNAGSAVSSGGLAGQVFWNTHLATAAASLMWIIIERVFTGKPTLAGASAGAVAGLVAITPACGFVESWASLVIGLIVAPICYAAVALKNKIHYDDTLDAFPLHGVGGVVGAFLTGIFATTSVNSAGFDGVVYGSSVLLGEQCIAIAVSAVFSFGVTLLIALLLKFTIGLRVTAEAEKIGLDVSEHGGEAYAEKPGEMTLKAL